MLDAHRVSRRSVAALLYRSFTVFARLLPFDPVKRIFLVVVPRRRRSDARSVSILACRHAAGCRRPRFGRDEGLTKTKGHNKLLKYLLPRAACGKPAGRCRYARHGLLTIHRRTFHRRTIHRALRRLTSFHKLLLITLTRPE